MATKILLDTDIGTDIDDAVCLAYLLAHPDCELVGITTVTGEAVKRAKLASSICKAAGRDVPIYPGSETPLLIPQGQKIAQQAALLHRWDHDDSYPDGEAIEFMRRTIRENPGEIVLLAIAPLTNIGLLFSVDPEIPALLKGLVMMCGRFLDPPPAKYGPIEWNARGDYHASAIVYRSAVKIHRSVGIDVTMQVSMTADEFRRTFRGISLFDPVLDYAEIWFKEWGGTVFHDPLAAATIFDESICRFEKGLIEVTIDLEGSNGTTRWIPGGKNHMHEVAISVDIDRFFQHFITTVKG